MKRSIINMLSVGLMAAFVAIPTANASGGAHLEPANTDVHDQMSLLRGAKYFTNYCQGCHSLKFSRYNRVAVDTGVSNEQIKAIIFTRDEDDKPTKVGALMTSAIPPKDAAKWFGTPPPDLSLVGRSRGSDWVYNYLKGFHTDASRPFGVNNTIFDSVGMPNVLADLQGIQDPVFRYDLIHQGHVETSFTSEQKALDALQEKRTFDVIKLGLMGESIVEHYKTEKEAIDFVASKTSHIVLLNKVETASFSTKAEADSYVKANPVTAGKYKVMPKSAYSVASSHKIAKVIDHLTLVKPGQQSPAEFDRTVQDLTNFLAYVSEPAQLHRVQYGIFTLLFLLVFFIFSYMLKKEYWKDIH
ncbi:MAG: cytochrome c1 [Cocleimonas sp.]|nr:cytochrome c1 [Cocleimonas sp.]